MARQPQRDQEVCLGRSDFALLTEDEPYRSTLAGIQASAPGGLQTADVYLAHFSAHYQGRNHAQELWQKKAELVAVRQDV